MALTNDKYRKLLKEIADNLTISDVGSIKFVCRGDSVGAAVLDKISDRDPLALFTMLQERQIISSENLTWLRDVLIKIQRVDLSRKIPIECSVDSLVDGRGISPVSGTISTVPISSNMVPLSSGISPYRSILKAVADELTSDNVNTMKFLLKVPGGIGEDIKNGETILDYMERDGKLSEDNFSYLKDVLNDIPRKDVNDRIDKMLAKKDLPSSPSEKDPKSCYPMDSRPHGFALVINIEKFSCEVTSDGVQLREREGSNVDVINLEKLWETLGFVVEKHTDLKGHELYKVASNMAKTINIEQKSSCFVCCIMSHGEMGKIYGTDGNYVEIKDITDLFKAQKCNALKGKPKLFFIQACRGNAGINPKGNMSSTPAPLTNTEINHPSYSGSQTLVLDQMRSDTNLVANTSNLDKDELDGENDLAIRRSADPNEPDFFLGYSTAPGYPSFRIVEEGTFYMKALTMNLGQHYETEDFLSMMLRVNYQVTQEYIKYNKKQCPVPVFTLVKKIYF